MKNNFVIEISNKKKIMAIKIAKIKYNNKKVMKINELGKNETKTAEIMLA